MGMVRARGAICRASLTGVAGVARVARVAVMATFLVGAAFASPVAADVIDRVLAIVVGEVITLSDGRGAVELGLVEVVGDADPLGVALDHLISRALILTEVERYPPPEPDVFAVDLRLGLVRQRFEDAAAFGGALDATGMTEARLRDLLRDDLRAEVYLEQRFGSAAQPTEDEVARYFQEHREEFARGGSVPRYVDVQGLARGRLEAERRRALIDDWTAGLRRRADVRVFYQAGAGSSSVGAR